MTAWFRWSSLKLLYRIYTIVSGNMSLTKRVFLLAGVFKSREQSIRPQLPDGTQFTSFGAPSTKRTDLSVPLHCIHAPTLAIFHPQSPARCTNSQHTSSRTVYIVDHNWYSECAECTGTIRNLNRPSASRNDVGLAANSHRRKNATSWLARRSSFSWTIMWLFLA